MFDVEITAHAYLYNYFMQMTHVFLLVGEQSQLLTLSPKRPRFFLLLMRKKAESTSMSHQFS
jgi:hypothetical protein